MAVANANRQPGEMCMAKSRTEMMALVGTLLADYAEFQRLRPDLPQGDLRDLSEKNWRCSSPTFSATGPLMRIKPIQRHRDLGSIEGGSFRPGAGPAPPAILSSSPERPLRMLASPIL
jgi:hypothetical protein